MNKQKSSQLHFIVGIGRSGTTILTKLLNEYKEIHCVPEANFLLFFLYKFKHKKHFSEDDLNMIFDQIGIYYQSNPWIGWDFDYVSIKQTIQNKLLTNKTIEYQELCTLIYANFKLKQINKEAANLIIDKNPSYSLFVKNIHTAFPNSKFIWIIRDYRANVLSWLQNPYLKASNVAFNAIRWKLYNKEIYNFYTKNKTNVLLIKYEDLILNQEIEIQNIINFLKVNSVLETNYLESTAIDVSNFSGSQEHKHIFFKKYTDLNQPLNSKRTEAWKVELNQSQIKTCDVLCSGFSLKIGYKAINKINFKDIIITNIVYIVPIINGYIDIYKDKLIYYVSIKLKLKKLKSRYLKLGLTKNQL